MKSNQDQAQTQAQAQPPALDASRYLTVTDPPVRSETVGENVSRTEGILHYRLVFPVDVRIDFLQLAQDSGYGKFPGVVDAAAKAALDRAQEKALRAPHLHTRWLAQEAIRKLADVREELLGMETLRASMALEAIDKLLTRIASFTTPEPEPENQFDAFPSV